jgi:hypothetical protein
MSHKPACLDGDTNKIEKIYTPNPQLGIALKDLIINAFCVAGVRNRIAVNRTTKIIP